MKTHVRRLLPSALCLLLLASAAPAQDAIDAARKQLEEGRPSEAVKLLKAALDEAGGGAPSQAKLMLLLAEAQIAAGDAQQAVETLAPLLEKSGGDHDALLAAGRAYKAWGDQMQREQAKGDDVGFAYDEARSYFEQASKKASRGHSAAAIELGNLELYVLGDHEAALGRAEKLLDNDSKDAEALLLKGCALLWVSIDTAATDEGQAQALRKEAIDALLAAEKALPKTRPEPWVQLAWLYEADGQAQPAVEAAIKALEVEPKTGVGTLFHLAKRYAGERAYDAAAVALAAMVRHDSKAVSAAIRSDADPTNAALLLSYAVSPMVQAQALAEARDALAAVVAAKPQHVDPWNNYAFLCRETRKYEESYEAYEEALKFQPDSPRLMNDTAVILHYYLHRDYPHAQELYEKAVETADEQLAGTALDETARADVQLARDDAVGNLKQLAAGDHDWP